MDISQDLTEKSWKLNGGFFSQDNQGLFHLQPQLCHRKSHSGATQNHLDDLRHSWNCTNLTNETNQIVTSYVVDGLRFL